MAQFIIKTSGPPAKIAVGGEFPRTGFVAPWKASILHTVGWTEANVQQFLADQAASLSHGPGVTILEALNGNLPVRQTASRNGRTFNYHFASYEVAGAFAGALGKEYPKDFAWPVSTVWHFVTRTADALLAEQGRGKFREDIVLDVDIKTLRSKKERHVYHMMALPSFVAAYATAASIPNPGFPLDELLVPDDQLIVNDQVQASLIGNADIGYENALLWQRRAALWKALGEDDPKRSQPKAAATSLSTTSDTLDTILQAATSPWAEPYWARIIPVPDPKVDATYDEDGARKRRTVPCLTEFFADEATARAAYQAERGNGGEKAAVADAAAVPAIWANSPDAWIAQIKEIKAKLEGDRRPPPLWPNLVSQMLTPGTSLYLGYDIGADAATVLAWLGKV